MASIHDFDLPPPAPWERFEDLVWDVCKESWGDPNAQKVGRPGQAQRGVDIFGHPGRGPELEGVQCKRTAGPPTEAELRHMIADAETFTPPLDSFVVATSASNDAGCQRIALAVSKEHQQLGLFRVSVWGWGEIQRRLKNYPLLVSKYYGNLFPPPTAATALDDRDRPHFRFATPSQSGTEEAFKPEWTVVLDKGDPLDVIEWRFRGPHFSMPWQRVELAHRRGSEWDGVRPMRRIVWEFDLRRPLVDDSEVAENELGVELRFEWRGRQCRELHRWRIERKVLPHKVKWDIVGKLGSRTFDDARDSSTLTLRQPADPPPFGVAVSQERAHADGQVWLALDVTNPVASKIRGVTGKVHEYRIRSGRARADQVPERGHSFVWTTTNERVAGQQTATFGPHETIALDLAMGKGRGSTTFCHAGKRAQWGYVGIYELPEGRYTVVLDIVSGDDFDKVGAIRVEAPIAFDGKGGLLWDGPLEVGPLR